MDKALHVAGRHEQTDVFGISATFSTRKIVLPCGNTKGYISETKIILPALRKSELRPYYLWDGFTHASSQKRRHT